MDLNELQIKKEQLTNELIQFNQNINEQKMDQNFKNDWINAEKNIENIKKNLNNGKDDYGYRTDSVAEAILASKLSIEAELENINKQIELLTPKTVESNLNNNLQPNLINNFVNSEDNTDLQKMNSTEKTFTRKDLSDISIKYSTTKPIPVSGSENNYNIPCHHDEVQKYGSNDCWAMTISLLFKVFGINMHYSEVKKYRPSSDDKKLFTTKKDYERLDNEIKSNTVVGLSDMKQIFTDILGDAVEVESKIILSMKYNNPKEEFIKELSAYLNHALSQGSPVAVIYSGHYTTISGIETKNNQTVCTVQNSSKKNEEFMTLEDYYNYVEATTGRIELLSLKKTGK